MEDFDSLREIKTDTRNTACGLHSEISNISEINSYGRSKLMPLQKKHIYDALADSFCNFFSSQGYVQENPVSINSGVDDSVYFVGAPTNVLKPYLLQGTLPEKGICMQQPSFRTHNAKHLKDPSPMRRGSTFTGISCMSNYNDGELLLANTKDFLLTALKIPLKNIAININSKDEDLLHLLDSVGNSIPLVFDTKEPKYYTHKYGLGDITGRNFNFVLRDENTGGFNDIGNYIIIEDQKQKYGIESGFGNSVIMKELYALKHILDTSVISDLVPGNSIVHRKLQDSIIASLLLYKLEIIPRKHDTKGRVFKRYLAGIKYNQEQLHIGLDELENILKMYENIEYHSSSGSDFILSQLKTIHSQ